jgi:putative NIF3 family GTP cyclohydrolase 1 type 2
MSVLVRDIISHLDNEAPFSLAETWDNVGLLVGNPDYPVTSLLIGLDPTNALIDEAIATGADTIITHHPVIFRPLACINTADPTGKLLEKALAHRIAIIACHTNLDSGIGMGRIGHYTEPIQASTFIRTALKTLDLPILQVAGTLPETVRTVAVCGGSGSDLAPNAFAQGADIYLSAEIKHSTARWAEEHNFCIIDGTHYGTERLAVQLLAEKFTNIGHQQNWNITISQTQTEKHPFVFIDTSNNSNNSSTVIKE